MKKIKNVSLFKTDDGQFILIMRFPSGRYYNYYGYDFSRNTWNCIAGGFDTLHEAEKMVLQHRRSARKINSMCINCKADCAKSTNHVWTSCIYRKT